LINGHFLEIIQWFYKPQCIIIIIISGKNERAMIRDFLVAKFHHMETKEKGAAIVFN
jgi:hypothetical protein